MTDQALIHRATRCLTVFVVLTAIALLAINTPRAIEKARYDVEAM